MPCTLYAKEGTGRFPLNMHATQGPVLLSLIQQAEHIQMFWQPARARQSPSDRSLAGRAAFSPCLLRPRDIFMQNGHSSGRVRGTGDSQGTGHYVRARERGPAAKKSSEVDPLSGHLENETGHTPSLSHPCADEYATESYRVLSSTE